MEYRLRRGSIESIFPAWGINDQLRLELGPGSCIKLLCKRRSSPILPRVYGAAFFSHSVAVRNATDFEVMVEPKVYRTNEPPSLPDRQTQNTPPLLSGPPSGRQRREGERSDSAAAALRVGPVGWWPRRRGGDPRVRLLFEQRRSFADRRACDAAPSVASVWRAGRAGAHAGADLMLASAPWVRVADQSGCGGRTV